MWTNSRRCATNSTATTVSPTTSTLRAHRCGTRARVSSRSPIRDDSLTILKEVIATYVEYVANVEANVGGERMGALMQARDRLHGELENKLGQMADLTQKIEVPMSQVAHLGATGAEIYREAFVRAEEAQARAQVLVAETDRTITELEALQARYEAAPHEPILELGIEDRLSEDPSVSALRQQQVVREAELEALSAQLTEGSVSLRRQQEEYDAIENKLATSETAARGQALRSLMAKLPRDRETYEKEGEGAQRRVEEIQQRIDAREAEYMALASKASMIAGERDELDLKAEETRSVLRGIRQEISDVTLESNAPARVKLASEPIVPNKPDTGRRFQLIALAFLGSLGAGMSAGLLREITDQHTRSARDVSGITRLPVLAAIPHFSEDRLVEEVNVPLLAPSAYQSPTADEYRRILARVIYPPESTVEINSCLIASPTRGDGKTSVACNLAVLLARANRRVLLVDSCWHAPRIEACFDLPQAPGLAEILCDGASRSSLVRPTELTDLDVLGPGLRTDEVAGKLASRNMMKFLEDAEQDYEHVIIDTEPTLLMSGAKLLAPVVDGVIVVAGVGVSTRGMIRRCLEEMAQVNAEVVGIVVNGIRRQRGGYLKKNLAMYYGYGEGRGDAEGDAELPEVTVVDEPGDDDSEPMIVLAGSDDDASDREDEQV